MKIALIACVIVLNSVMLRAQDSKTIVLQNADLFTGKRLDNGEDVRDLTGHVRFKQGNVRAWCDRAIQYLNRNEIELIGNVKVIRDTVTLTARHSHYFGNSRRADCDGDVRLKTPNVTLSADIGTYYIDEKKAFFQKNVKVVDSSTTIYSEQLTYYENERKSIAMLHVKIVNSGDNITMFGNYLEHFDSTKYSKMSEHPRLMQIDTSDKGEIDTLAVKSMTMESFDDSARRMVATDSVVIVRGQLAARCGLVKYYVKDQAIELYTSPTVWYDNNQVTGDTIFLAMRNNRLQKASVSGKAFVISQSDSTHPDRYDQLTGRSITMWFDNNKLQETYVERNAISLYYLYDKTEPNGANKTSGDYIRMKFSDGRPDTIKVTHGIEGIYYPENIVEKKGSGYDLDGFRLITDRPVFTTIFPTKIY